MKNSQKAKKKKALFIGAVIVGLSMVQAKITKDMSEGKMAKGNKEEFSVANTPALPENELGGKRIIFLGSSVTYGSAAMGESFVDFMAKRDGILPVKEAVSGTTLVDEVTWGKESYITRMKRIDPAVQADAFVCQLSTNDATMKKPLGEISEGFDLETLDVHTIAGAIEYVIGYAKETWHCPVAFYTGTRYDDAYYGELVALLLKIQEKWGIGVLNLWDDPEMNAVSKEDYKLYMVNDIHPSRAGYREWWTPKFETYLKDFLAQ